MIGPDPVKAGLRTAILAAGLGSVLVLGMLGALSTPATFIAQLLLFVLLLIFFGGVCAAIASGWRRLGRGSSKDVVDSRSADDAKASLPSSD